MISAFFEAFLLLFIAELGDKTQLIILTLASKGYSSKKLAIGASLGFAAIVALGGIIALLLNSILDLSLVNIISGTIFVIIAVFQIIANLKNNEEDKENKEDKKKWENNIKNGYLLGFFAIFSMELGDKTQVMTIILTMTSHAPLITLFGAWFALSLLAIIGAFIGEKLSEKISKTLIDWISSAIFLIIGLLMIVSAL